MQFSGKAASLITTTMYSLILACSSAGHWERGHPAGEWNGPCCRHPPLPWAADARWTLDGHSMDTRWTLRRTLRRTL